MTVEEEIFQLDTEIKKLSKALCAIGLIKQHIKHSNAYIPERHNNCLVRSLEELIAAEKEIYEEIGQRLCVVLNCNIIDDEILDAFLHKNTTQNKEEEVKPQCYRNESYKGPEALNATTDWKFNPKVGRQYYGNLDAITPQRNDEPTQSVCI